LEFNGDSNRENGFRRFFAVQGLIHVGVKIGKTAVLCLSAIPNRNINAGFQRTPLQ